MKRALVGVCVGLVISAASLATRADAWNKKTYVSFGGSIAIPGLQSESRTTLLSPGEYVLTLMNSSSNRTIVMVHNEDESELQGLVLAIPAYRLETTDDPLLVFKKDCNGRKVLRKWFFAGELSGLEFVDHHPCTADVKKNLPSNPGSKTPEQRPGPHQPEQNQQSMDV